MRVVYEIKKRGYSVIGMMIGDTITETDRKYKQNIDTYICKHDLKHDIYAPGFRSDIADILAATDCVIVPSYEGLGLVAMEAMCARTSVVAQDSGGSNELMRAAHFGEMYPSDGTEKDVADAVIRAMKQSDYVLENGYRFCMQNSYKNYSKGLHGVFECMK